MTTQQRLDLFEKATNFVNWCIKNNVGDFITFWNKNGLTNKKDIINHVIDNKEYYNLNAYKGNR